MPEIHISVIGLGPRGLTVLESIGRLVHNAGRFERIVVHLIDPNQYGQGCHSSRQPEHLLTNTLASQVTIFPLKDPNDPGSGNTGPSFTEWARLMGYRRCANRYLSVNEAFGHEIEDNSDYLPRSLLGDYLTWCYRKIVQEAPECIRYINYRQRAVDIIRDADNHWIIRLNNGFTLRCDFVFITTGHCESVPDGRDRLYESFVQDSAVRNWRLSYIRMPYPIDRLSQIDPNSTVAIQGLGLTAHDVISELTTGRGGRFITTKQGLDYQPSGDEPQLLIFSRHCLPAAARGVNQKGIADRHHARFFTPDAIRRLRERAIRESGSPQLDFKLDILPIIKKEMCLAWRLAQVARPALYDDFVPSVEEMAAIEDILDPIRDKSWNDLQSFRQYAVSFLKADLAEAVKGNLGSPAKAATDVIRDTRDALCAAVEYRGLTPESHRLFVEEFVPVMNRISFGPPRRRNEELIALIDAGIIDWGGGPGARIVTDSSTGHFVIETPFQNDIACSKVDVLIRARLDAFLPEADASPLIQNLLRRGLVQPHMNGNYHPGGVDIDWDGHPIGRDGHLLRDVWVLGYPAEGVHFYTHALPRPMRNSRQILDAEKCVRQMLEYIDGQQQSDTVLGEERAA